MTPHEERLDAVIEALAHLICSEPEEERGISRAHRKHHALPRMHWDGFEVLVGDDEDNVILTGDHANDQPVWPIDYSIAFPNSSDGWPDGTWQFTRIRTLDPKRWRGKLRMVTPRMVEEAILSSQPNGEHITFQQAWSIIGNRARLAPLVINSGSPTGMGQFMVAPGWYGTKGRGSSAQEVIDDESGMTMRLRMAGGFGLRRYYLWSVLLGEGTGPRARFATDPVGVREAFRLRDIPPGKQRRAALLHWVRAHWRKSGRGSAEDRARVQAYLRGVWSYTWNGLRCQIEPSTEDMETLAK